MNKINRYILTFLTLLATTATWGYNITFRINDTNKGNVIAVLSTNTNTQITTANKNDVVWLIASPVQNYILSSNNLKITAYSDPGRADTRTEPDVVNTISFSPVEGQANTYSFTMPDYDVVVDAEFTDATDITESANITLQDEYGDISGYSNVYDWRDHTPSVKSVMMGSNTLVAGTDYTVVKTSNISQANDNYHIKNVGETITFTFSGIKKYKGTKVVTYSITPRTINDAVCVLAAPSLTYNLGEQKPQVQSVTITENTTDHVLNVTTDYTVTYPDNVTDVGTKTVTITGTGNFKDSKEVSYTINPRTITESMVALAIPSGGYTYDGSAKQPAVTVTDGTTVLGTNDYTVTYDNNVNVGNSAQVTVTGKGNYTGTVDKFFSIAASDITPANFTVTFTGGGTTYRVTYDGSLQTPGIVVKDGNTTLTQGTHYTVAYSNNQNAGTATITVTGLGNYSGTKTLTFTIDPIYLTAAMVDLTDTNIDPDTENFTYNGLDQKPSVVVTNGSTLIYGSDYTYSFTTSDNVAITSSINQGTYKVLVVGRNNYAGTITKTYTIARRNISSASVTLSTLSSYVYDGTVKKPTVSSVAFGSSDVVPATDYDVAYSTDGIAAGTVTVTVTGKNNHTGTITTPYTIQPKAVTASMISLDYTSFTYTGSLIKPNVTVSDGSLAMTIDTDYTLENNGGTLLGTYNVTITGKGNYTGTATVTFEIVAQGASAFTIEPIANQEYTGSPLTPALTVKNQSGTTLTPTTDYTVTYANNTNVGTATVTVTGAGNYLSNTSTKTAQFTITPKSLTSAMVSLSQNEFVYNGELQKPTVTVEDGTALTTNDYDVADAGGINVGTYNVTVTGKGNYTGTIGSTDGKTYTITQKSITGAEVTLNALDSYVFCGVAKTPTVRQVTIGTLVVPTEGYTVSYSGNINAGTATVTLTGTGNFKDSATKTFTIERKLVTTDMIIFNAENFVYDGTVKKPVVTIKDGETTLISGQDYSINNPDQTEVGSYDVTITGLTNYTGAASRPYSIVGKDADTQFTVNLAYESTTFTGSAMEPTVTVTVTDGTTTTTLINNTDYTVSYTNNVNAGTATAIVTGKGHYAGTKTATFTINPKPLLDGMVTLSADEFIFNGANQKPTVSVTDGTILTSDDYIVTNAGGINADTYHVVVNGTRNYSGTIDKTFTIGQLDLASASVSLVTLSSYVYDGLAKEPGIQSISFSGGLTVTSDGYSAVYADNVNVGTATITLTGRGNYKGTKIATFNILPQTITAEMITLSNEQYTYNGKVQKPEVSVKCGATTLTAGVDYSVENDGGTSVGEYEVKVTGLKNYNGSATKKYTIVEQKVFDFNVTLDKESVIYNGKPQEVEVTVKDGDTVLKQGVQYTLVYTNNINVGTASIVITGHGDYSGSKTTSFLINPKALTEEMVKLDSLEFVYNATVRKPVVSVEDEGIITTNDFTVTNSGGKDCGTYSVVVTGKNNYTGTITRQFTIRQCDIAGAKVVLNELTSYVYDGKAKNPGVREVIVNNIIVPSDNYTTSISSNINVGTATVTVTAHGNYTGTAKATFKILPKSITEGMVTLSSTVFVYDGSVKKPTVTVTDGDKTLSAQKDYNVSGDGGIEAGEYEMLITGIVNYTDQVTKKFTIQYGGSVPVDPEKEKEEKETEFLFMPTSPSSNEVSVSGVVLSDSIKSTTFSVTIPANYKDGDKTYAVVGISEGAFKGMKNMRDIYLPETETPISIGNEAIPSTTTVHVSLANLDDYALSPSLEDNFISGNVVATVSAPNRYWTFSSGVDVRVPENVRVFIVSGRDDSTVAITELTDDQLLVGGQRLIKANNGVLFASDDNDTVHDLVASAKRMDSGTPITTDNHRDYGSENCLVPVIEPTHFSAGSYFFMKDNEFHRIQTEDASVKVPAGKAVLYLGSAAQSRGISSTLGIVNGDGTTAINDLRNDNVDLMDGKWYSLDGRQLNGMPTKKGMYIHNKKKVVIK